MKAVQGIELSYTVELTDTMFGFQLPGYMIRRTVQQFFQGIREFGKYIKEQYGDIE